MQTTRSCTRNLAALGAVLFVSACGFQSAYRPPVYVQREYARTLRPTELSAPSTPAPSRALRTYRVRVYADDEHQAQTRRWEDRFRAQVSRANELLEKTFAVHLEVESFRGWPRKHRGSDLETALSELIDADSGDEVDWVVGLVSPLQMFSASHDTLGLAPYFGRHFVLRGMDSLGETQALQEVLNHLPVDEREALFRERKLHKETAVLLHEWAHTLGAPHVRSSDCLMSAMYEARQAPLSPEEVAIIDAGLTHRENRTEEGKLAWGKAYRALIDAAPKSLYGTAVLEEAHARARHVLEGEAPGQAQLTALERVQYQKAVEHYNARAYAEADAIISPLASGRPQDGVLASFHCEVGAARELPPDERIQRCRAAAELDPKNPRPLLIIASAFIHKSDGDGANAALEQAEMLLENKKATASDWTWVAAQHLELRNVSRAERAAAKAPMHQSSSLVESDCSNLRRWLALPRDGRVPEAREREYLGAMQTAVSAAEQKKFKVALERADWIAKNFPEAPGPGLIRCQVVTRQNVPNRVLIDTCEGAVKAWDELVFPVYALGVFAEMSNQPAVARKHFDRARELHPRWESPWRSLVDLHRRSGDKAALQKTQEEYRKQFGRDL